MRPYKVLITHEVLSLRKPPAGERPRILSFLDRLAADPFQKGDYEEKDGVGRPVQIKIIGTCALTTGLITDEEVKVIRVEQADRD